MKTHDNQKPFQCTVCNRGYNTAAALTSHMQNHKKQIALTGSPTLTYSSRYSPRSTGSASSITSVTPKRRPESVGATPIKSPLDFMNFPKSSSGFSCLYCTKSDFISLDQLHSHIQTMHGGPMKTNLSSPASIGSPVYQIQCEFCTIKCPNMQGLFNHMKSTHLDKIQSPNTYLEQFKSIYNPYSPRLRVQNGQDDSPNIKEENKSSPEQNIKVEEQDEEEEQTSPTDLSQPKTKKPKVDVNNEKATHSPTSPQAMRPGTFLCNQCTAALPNFESFRAHLKSHLDNGSSSFVCQTCGTSFADQIEYERHVISHFLVQASEFSCTPQCTKTYGKPDDLQKHLVEMHAQTLYKCSLCSEIFETKVAIQVHFAVTHSNETKIFRCSACSDSFKNERDFR